MDQHPGEQSLQSPPTPGYTLTLELRWSDQDLYGHVNNARIVTLAEEARVRFAQQTGAEADGGAGTTRVVARQTVEYHAPVHYGPELTLQVGVLRVGTSSYTLRQRGHQSGRPVFTVDTVMVALDPDHRPRPLGEDERRHLQDWTWPQDTDQEDTARS